MRAPEQAANGYRQYALTDVERLRLLVGLCTLNLPIDRAGELAALCGAGHSERVSTELHKVIARQRADVRRRADDHDFLDRRLATLERHLAAGDPPQSVIPRGGALLYGDL